MNPLPLSSAEIADIAIAWWVRRAEGLSPEDEAALAAWLAADARHAQAWRQVESAHRLLNKWGAAPAEVAPAASLRRREWWQSWTVALPAAVALVLGTLLWPARPPAPLPSEPPYGADQQPRQIMLPDGSSADLNQGARLAFAFSRGERRVVLQAGEAHFSVKKDPARPFVVVAGEFAIRAVGTAFNVRLAEASVEVLVTDGKVNVEQARELAAGPGEAAPPATAVVVPAVVAGQRVVMDRAGRAEPDREILDTVEVNRVLAWQPRSVIFADTPLADAVALLNRRHPLQLVIEDPVLASRPIAGKVWAESPEMFARLLEATGDIEVDRSQPGRIILRRTQ